MFKLFTACVSTNYNTGNNIGNLTTLLLQKLKVRLVSTKIVSRIIIPNSILYFKKRKHFVLLLYYYDSYTVFSVLLMFFYCSSKNLSNQITSFSIGSKIASHSPFV